ncbi:MAG: transglycosylase SLT domain-containing protein, partial [Patescibacteria group bacterium]
MRVRPDSASEILATIPVGTRVVIVQKGKDGESLLDGYLSDIWHEVVHDGKRGFIHSSLLEIAGQERDRIIDAIKNKAKEVGVEEKLALNLAHCESKWLPFAHSKSNNKGIYQLGVSTIDEINEKHGGHVTDPYDPFQNIDGGLKYFKYLLTRYAGSSDSLARTIAGWNAGPNKVSVTGFFDITKYKEAKKLTACMLHERRGEQVMGVLKIFAVLLCIGISTQVAVFFISDDYRNLHADEKYLASVDQMPVFFLESGKNVPYASPSQARETEVFLAQLRADMDGDKKLEKIGFSFYSPEDFDYRTKMIAPNGEEIWLYGSFWQAFVDDLTADGIQEVIVSVLPGHMNETHIFSYNNGALQEIPMLDERGEPTPEVQLGTRLEVSFKDLDNNGTKEIILPIRDFSDRFITPTFYYRWNGKGFMLYDSKEIAQDRDFKG